MDANGTRYQLILGFNDWASCLFPTPDGWGRLGDAWALPVADDDSGLEWNAARHEITLQQDLFQFPAATNDRPPRIEDRRGAARDRYGSWYWIAENKHEILVNGAGSGRTTHFWAVGDGVRCATEPRFGEFQPVETAPPPAPAELSGLAITVDHYLVVGVVAPAGLLIFDLHAGGSPQQVFWPPSVPFAPWDMAAAPGGGVWILDRAYRRYWALDRQLNVLRQDQIDVELAPEQVEHFQPVGGGPERRSAGRSFPTGIAIEAAVPLDASDPVAIEALPDSTVLILDRRHDKRFSLVYRYRLGTPVGAPVSTESMLELIDENKRASFTLVAHDFGFVAAYQAADGVEVEDRLYIVSSSGNQAFAFRLGLDVDGEQLTLEPVRPPLYLPMRLWGGKALVAAGAEVFYDFADRWIPLVEQRRPRFEEVATLFTPVGGVLPDSPDAPPRGAFDGREPDCVWHRLLLDACIPPDTDVQVWSRAANDEADLLLAPWQPEPRLYLRGAGSELPFVAQPTSTGNGTWELLFQRAHGRFLQLKLQLSGNRRTTPRLRALRAYYPRFSYLTHYLPAVYREDTQSASFLDRFLANIEGLFTALEDRVAAAQILFDVRSAPSEVLDWLASWLGVALDPVWDETRRRLFIKHSMLFFQYRGTLPGLQMALRLALDECVDDALFAEAVAQRNRPGTIRIVETFRTRRTPPVLVGDPTGGPRLVNATARWTPPQGGAVLHARYRAELGLDATELFPLQRPTGDRGDQWQRFAADVLGFVPAAASIAPSAWRAFLRQRYTNSIAALNTAYAAAYPGFDAVPVPRAVPRSGVPADGWEAFALRYVDAAVRRDQERWQAFLARRYRRINALNDAYNLAGAERFRAFADVLLPAVLPPDGAALLDWFQFEGVVLAMQRAAHRFSVLLPMPTTATVGTPEYRRRLELAQRIVELEKPAHTIFDCKLYWALFRIGEARLGLDTQLDQGSRSAALLPPLILGQEHLAESYQAPGHPQNVGERYVLGRERLAQRSGTGRDCR